MQVRGNFKFFSFNFQWFFERREWIFELKRTTVLLVLDNAWTNLSKKKEMKFSALLTSAGINIGLCTLFLSLYSLLRKQPGFVYVYFGRRISEENDTNEGSCILDRFVPSPSWIVRAWEYKQDDILSIAGLDAVVFLRILVFRWVRKHLSWFWFSLAFHFCCLHAIASILTFFFLLVNLHFVFYQMMSN